MGFPESLKAHLGGDSTIQSLASNRIHPLRLPEGSDKPSIVYSRVGVVDQTDLDANDGNLQEVRVQVDCWAPLADQAFALGEAVRRRMQSATVAANSFKLGASFSQDLYEPETKLFRVTFDFTCWYRTS